MSEEDELKKVIGDNGTINLYYGGYEIVVLHKKKFNWEGIFDCLFKYNYSVFVTKKEENLCIIAKQVY